MPDTLRVNPITCSGHGVCAELLPELISLDEWGYPIVDPHPVPPALDHLAGPRPDQLARADLERWAGLVTGRGACNHPDGTVRFVRSTLTVFAPEIARHAQGHCSASNHGATNRTPFLPLPDRMPLTEDDWI